MEQAQKDADALTLRLNALEAQQVGWRGQGEQLSSSVQQLSLSVQEKDKAIQELKRDYQDLLKEQEEAGLKIKDYEVVAAQCAATTGKSQKEKEKFSHDLISAKQEITDHKNKLARLDQLQKERASLDAKISSLQAQAEAWQSQTKELNGSVRQFTSLLQEKDKAIQDLKSKQQDLLKQNDADALKIGGYELKLKELEQLYKDKAALEVRLKDLDAEQAILKSKNQELSKTCAS